MEDLQRKTQDIVNSASEQDDYQRQVEQVQEARELNRGIHENNRLSRVALWLTAAALIMEIIQTVFR